ncbi:hypothetical protein P3W45_000219 [Vairimorpha bombi]
MHKKGKMELNKILSEITIKNQVDTKTDSITTNDSIKDLMNKYKRVLLITDSKEFSSHFRLKFVQILPSIKQTPQLVLHPSKFILFSWQGLLDVFKYDLVIVNCELKMDFIHAFRVFYIDNIVGDLRKPSCIVYSNKITEKLSIYFQSMIDDNSYVREKEIACNNLYKCYSLDIIVTEDILNYIKCKRVLKDVVSRVDNDNYVRLLKEVAALETKNIGEAVFLLNRFVDINKVRDIPDQEDDMIAINDLLIFHQKKNIIEKYLKSGTVILKSRTHLDFENVQDYKDVDKLNTNSSVLIIWDSDDEDEIFHQFKKIIYFKICGDYPNRFINTISKKEYIDEFIDYTIKRDREYRIEKGRIGHSVPTLSWEYSVLFLEHILYLIGRVFHDNFLYIRSINVNRIYHSSANGDKYYCYLEFPNIVGDAIFTQKYKSDEFTQKKDATKDVSYKAIISLVESGYLDSNFLPVTSKFIDNNTVYHKYIKDIYEIDYKNPKDIQKMKEFSFDLYDSKDQSALNFDEVLRKQADSMEKFTSTVSLYVFNNSNLGICTDKSFQETISYKNTEVSFIKEFTMTESERSLILNYQVIFFGINFKRMTSIEKNIRKYAYLVVPMKNGEIDYEYMTIIYKNFFIGNVYSVQDRNILNNFLLFNPITKTFYEYVEETDKKLTDMTTQKIKGWKKKENSENEVEEYTFQEYFRRLYGINLVNIIDDTNIIFSAMSYTTKNKEKKIEYHSGEIIYVTTVKKSIKCDYRRFIEYFNIFETISLIYEFKCRRKLSVSLKNLVSSFSPREILDGVTDLGYERFEFIGDSVLKYATSKYLFTECGYSLNRLVSTKDSIICNNHLYQIGRKIELQNYFSFNKYSENLFQPPAILDEIDNKSLIDNLGVSKIFMNNNQYYFVKEYNKKQVKEEDLEKGRKVYADIVESLIGVHYVEQGFNKAWEFIKKIGIVESKEIKDKSEIYLLCDYEGIFPFNYIGTVEEIIDYKFINKGYLEKAMIHPSYKNNIFGSERFQKLELVGDCFLDLKVSDYIYKKYTEADPCELHTHRKRLVNNFTFAMILFKTGLVDISMTGLDEKTRDATNNKISKCYSDILESLAGAVVLDAGFNLEKTQRFFDRMLIYMEENTHDC